MISDADVLNVMGGHPPPDDLEQRKAYWLLCIKNIRETLGRDAESALLLPHAPGSLVDALQREFLFDSERLDAVERKRAAR